MFDRTITRDLFLVACVQTPPSPIFFLFFFFEARGVCAKLILGALFSSYQIMIM